MHQEGVTPTEQKYTAIEKEALGLVFGCQKLDEYIYGREITLETDHKPLVSIPKKPLADISPQTSCQHPEKATS